MNKNNRRLNRRAFTIVEILVVVIIIGVLATLIAPKLFQHIGQAQQTVAKNNIIAIENAIDIFRVTYDRMPKTLEELVTRPADIDEAKWNSPTIKAKNLLDPWGREFIYKQPGEHGVFDIYSLGKDGQEGGKKDNADVTNW